MSFPLNRSSQLHRPFDGDLMFNRTSEEAAQMFWPSRICGEISFRDYRSMHVLSCERYLKFLTELEKSHSRHDFLFWIFDIITAGREQKNYQISNYVLDGAARHYFFDIVPTINACRRNLKGSLSAYIVSEYPYLFGEECVRAVKRGIIFNLSTYQSHDEQLWNYRESKFQEFVSKIYPKVNYNHTFYLNPMENLCREDFPKEQYEKTFELAYKPVDKEYFEYINSLPFGYDDNDLGPALRYFMEMLTFTEIIQGKNGGDQGILVNKNPYKQKQVEEMLKKIDTADLVPINLKQIYEFGRKRGIVIAKIPNSDRTSFTFERAEILSANPKLGSSEIYCVDTGNRLTVNFHNIFLYDKIDLKLSSFREALVVPGTPSNKGIVTLAERIPLEMLPENVQVNDFFCHDAGIFTDGNEKYLHCGRPKKPKNFFRNDSIIPNGIIKVSSDDFKQCSAGVDSGID